MNTEKHIYTNVEDWSNKMKDAGYKVHKFDATTPSGGRYDPFNGTFDVFGDKRKDFVEKLNDIFTISIIEEDDTYIRFAYTEKNYVFHNECELQKAYADYVALWDSMKGHIEMTLVDESQELKKMEEKDA